MNAKDPERKKKIKKTKMVNDEEMEEERMQKRMNEWNH